jgi:hypothetical protein
MNRAQRILHFVAGRTTAATLSEIVGAAEPAGPYGRFSAIVSAQLHGLVEDGKLARTGQPRAFLYTATATTLRDGRKIDHEGKPRNAVKTARARKPPKPATPPPKPAAHKAAHAIQPSQRIAITRVSVSAPRQKGERETVEEFLARGGRIERLSRGAASRPVLQTKDAITAERMRNRIRADIQNVKATNEDDYEFAA